MHGIKITKLEGQTKTEAKHITRRSLQMSNEYTYGPLALEDAKLIVAKINLLRSNSIRSIEIVPDVIDFCIILVLHPDKAVETYQFFRGFLNGAGSILKSIRYSAEEVSQ